MGRLNGKVSMITGASSGIAKRTAEIFAEEGSDLILVDIQLEKLQRTASDCEEKGVKVIIFQCDISNYEEVKTAVDGGVKAFGRIDILVNCAGIVDKHRPVTRCDTDWWDKIIKIDQYSIYYFMKEVLVHMEAAGKGSIVNIASISGTCFNGGFSYTAAKSATIGMTKNVAIQFAGKGIRCNCVAPGSTPTALNAPEVVKEFDQEFSEICRAHNDCSIPLVTTDDQAYAILYFACDESKGVTGQVLVVDGGRTL